MGSATVKQNLRERTFTLDPEQFENLCKILIQEVEQPRSIEVTPFGGDGGIDIKGSSGTSFFDHRFGVQVKQNSPDNTVGKPRLRNFVGAIHQHGCQYGCFITSSSFVSDIDIVVESEPVVLVDRSRLFDIMIANGVGVKQINSRYKIDNSFWSLFEAPHDDDLIPSILVPQADNLDVMHVALEAIYEGKQFKPQIVDHMVENTDRDSWEGRQADYYPNAALALSFVHKDTKSEYQGKQMQRWSLTKKGREYIEYLNSDKSVMAKRHLADCIREVEIVSRILSNLRDEGSLTHSDIGDIIRNETELSGQTVGRRLSTIGKWLTQLPEVNRVHDQNSYRYDYIEKPLTEF